MKQDKLLIIIFALILVLPTLDSFFNFSPVKELFEKRLPLTKPQFSFSSSYSQDFEKYFNDNYGFRKTLISLNSKIMDKLFDESPDARAVIGKDGWFYFDNYNSLLDAAGKATVPDQMIERAVESFYKNWQLMREKNIKYLLVIAADKGTIYPEFLPDYIVPGSSHRIDKFLDAMKQKYPDFPVLDLRPILLAAKEKEILYQKTDTHWNRRGAHYAYVEMMKKFGIKPHLRNEFNDKDDDMIRGDISDIMGVDTQNRNYDLEPKFKIQHRYAEDPRMKSFHKGRFVENDDKNLPILFTYKDSYFADLIDFTAEHFSKSYYVNEFPCDLNYEIIKNFHPDVVIQEFWEGRLEVVFNQCQ